MTGREADWRDWRAARMAALAAPDGWLNLIDRIDLPPGLQTVGAAADNALQLSAGPDHLGAVEIDSAGARLIDGAGVAHPFLPKEGAGPQLAVANLILEIHTVEGQPALRVRQVDHPARLSPPDIATFPFAPEWVVTARWEALPEPEARAIDMVGGRGAEVRLTHRARFAHEGAEVVLLPTHWKDGRPMFVIRDATSGRETYGASRFLLGDVLDDRTIRLDFNRLHNPPCAFTEFAICPLPPAENRLFFPIRAGEMKP
ncbi:DUF1684 domain-containing protein [Aliigemmobacter aestuarii]|uniref:DUF1684 domain-containing protein n=1 Tax=Aliigemmobacter aestuarii TaxID=1445661 RepID=A0A4S3MLQ1_9RHOB|nr:DUF1684 domain-containing protein [Gemmobacter aestuarii]THD83154.1 DUF1684 domain-containing protein [Gemmobacter aestuarii]